MEKIRRKKVKRIGSERPDFEIEATPVEIRKTFKGRVVDTLWTVIASAIGITLVHVFVLPLL